MKALSYSGFDTGLSFLYLENRDEYYIARNTDNKEEARKVVWDVTFLLIGGTYTMDYKEVVEEVKELVEKQVEILIK